MALVEKVEHHEVLNLSEFSKENFIRKSLVQSKGIVCDFVCFEPGQAADMHKHPVQDEIFYIVDGKGVITFEDRDDISVKTGSVVFIPSGLVHGVKTVEAERLILMLTKGPGITTKTARAFMHS